MKIIKREGKSEFEVVTGFMKEFNLKRNQFNYEIVDKGSNGFFNLFGAKPVVINFMLQQGDDEGIKSFIEELLNQMGVDFEKVTSEKKNDTVIIDLVGVKEKGFVIGKDGKLLNSIQHLANRMLLNKGIEDIQVVVDCEGYRKNHEKQILGKARNVAEKVKQRNKSFTFDPMRATDRKIIHRYIEKDKTLRTMTVGKGDKKRVVVMPDSEEKLAASNNNNVAPRDAEKDGGRPNAKPRRRRRPRRPNNGENNNSGGTRTNNRNNNNREDKE